MKKLRLAWPTHQDLLDLEKAYRAKILVARDECREVLRTMQVSSKKLALDLGV